jgi:pseudouridine kinase
MDIQGRSAAAFRPGDSNPGLAALSPGGVGRNIAENLVRLGLCVELVTILGDDALSLELEESCARLGIGLSAALRLPNEAASQYICLLDADGSLVGAVAAMDSFDRLSPQVLAERADFLDAASLIVVDANIPGPAIGWLAARYGDRARRGGGPALALDTVSVAKASRARPYLGSFAFAKPNRAEAAVLAGFDIAVGRDVELVGPALAPRDADLDLFGLASGLRDTGLREVFISLGEEGLYYEGPNPDGGAQRGFVRPPRPLPAGLEPVNVSGAGDAACAALVWGFLRKDTLAQRARCALAAAMVTAASIGTAAADLEPERLIALAKGVVHESLS